MPVICRHPDIDIPSKKVFHDVPSGTNLLNWLCENVQGHAATLHTEVFLNGAMLESTDKAVDIELSDGDVVAIRQRPAGAVAAFAVAHPFLFAGGVAVASIGLTLLLPKPKLPGSSDRADASQNNQLNASTNEFRNGREIPDCYGEMIRYPDFIQPAYFEYVNNIKVFYELFSVGRGRYNIDDVKTADTLIDDIAGASWNAYEPGNKPSASKLITVVGTDEVDGQTLPAPDDSSQQQTINAHIGKNVYATETITVTAAGGGGSDISFDSGTSTVVTDFGLVVTDSLIIAYTGQPQTTVTITAISGDEQTITVAESLTNDTGVSASLENPQAVNTEIFFTSGTETFVADTGIVIGDWLNSIYDSNDHIAQIIDISGDEQTITVSGILTRPTNVIDNHTFRYVLDASGTPANWQGWFVLPNDEATGVWFQIIKQPGSDADRTVNVEWEVERLSDGIPTGDVTSGNVDVTTNSFDEFGLTEKTATLTAAQYRARVRRSTNKLDAPDDRILIEDIQSVTPQPAVDFGNVTLLDVERRATRAASAIATSKINIKQTRLLETFNRSTGQLVTNDFQPTRDFADAALNVMLQAGYQLSSIDTETLYGINDGLADARLGYFDFAFDDENVQAGERIITICNAARVTPFREGQIWTFTRDEEKTIRTALFNRRNVVPNSAKQTQTLQLPLDKRAVSVKYVDPDENVGAYEYREIVGGAITTPTEEPLNAVKIDLAGCRNQFQAGNRADLEIRRFLYQRLTVEDEIYFDAFYVGLNDRVGWVDINDLDTFDGEIIGVNGDDYDTSERFAPEDGETYFVYLTDDQGNVSASVECTARSDTEFGFTASGLTGAYSASGLQQSGSRYLIAKQDDQAAADYTVTARVPQDGSRVKIRLSEYNSLMYELDP